MKRIGRLTIVAVAALALTGLFGASSAAASDFEFDGYPATFSGSVVGTPQFKISGSTISCEKGGNLVGTASEATETLTPAPYMEYSSCSRNVLGNKVPVTVDMNSCVFVFHAGGEASPNKGTFDVGPAGCGQIELVETGCTRLIGPQTGLTAVYQSKGSGNQASVDIAASGGLKFTVVKSGSGCTEGAATFSANWAVTAHDGGGNPLGMHLTSDAVGFGVAGESFEAASYPVTVTGLQTGEHVWSMGGNKLRDCDGVVFDGALSAASSALTLSAVYEGCSYVVLGTPLPATVSMNSCQYVFDVTGGSSGTMDVSCAKEGDKIEVKVYASKAHQEKGETLCIHNVGAQNGISGIGYSNLELGVSATFNLTNIAYTRTGSALCGSASGKGTYTGASEIYALP